MEEINLIDLSRYYLKKIPMILLIILLTLVGGIFYIQAIQVPMYHGTTTIILVQKNTEGENGTVTQNDITINEKLVTTYSNLIKSRRVLAQVINSLRLDTTSTALANQIDVTSVSDTAIIKITVSDKDNQQAVLIANKIAAIFKQEIITIYDLENVSIIDEAILEDTPYNVNIPKQIAIYLLIGVVLSCGIVFVMFYFDNTIKNKKEIETKLNLPVLGEIPLAKKMITQSKKGNRTSSNEKTLDQTKESLNQEEGGK